MKRGFYGYIRVSTARQGEKGVSLAEQRDAIERYAERNTLEIVAWFEERETAARRGRPVFTGMLKLLREGKAAGVVIHKIDRSARNMKDWADVGELMDDGVEVRFVNEGIDLNTRGGRLSADIQAVVAADFIRNLREETKKGFYGRLKQGLYPMPAPLGYLDHGKGAPKTIDPMKGPLVRIVFELYSTGKFTLNELVPEVRRLGLRNRSGGRVTKNGLSVLLRNPFYVGLIRLRSTGETFQGKHEQLILTSLFHRVQEVLDGKSNGKVQTHEFLFRRMFSCTLCGSVLVGERQKGHVYYRCHTPTCPTTGVREEAVQGAVLKALKPLRFADREMHHLRWRLGELRREWVGDEEKRRATLGLRLDHLEDRLVRLTDALLDNIIDRELFEQRKQALLMERQKIKEQLAEAGRDPMPGKLAQFLELARSAYVSYEMGLDVEKRELLSIVTSNRQVDGKTPVITLSTPFDQVAKRSVFENGSPYRDRLRTSVGVTKRLTKWLGKKPIASYVAMPKKDNKLTGFGKGEGVAA